MHDLPMVARSSHDMAICLESAHLVQGAAGRDGNAFLKLAWARGQSLAQRPDIWRAVCNVEGALFSGLIWAEPGDPKPGDRVQFVLGAAEVERLVRSTALAFGALAEEHSCRGGACVRRRPISRRFHDTPVPRIHLGCISFPDVRPAGGGEKHRHDARTGSLAAAEPSSFAAAEPSISGVRGKAAGGSLLRLEDKAVK